MLSLDWHDRGWMKQRFFGSPRRWNERIILRSWLVLFERCHPIDFGNPYVVSRTYVRRTHAQERKILEFCLKRSLFHHSWLIPSFIRFVLGGACVVRPYFGLLGLFRFLNSFLDWFDNYIQYCRRFIHDSFIHDSFIQLIDFFHATTLRRERERY